MNIIRIYYTTHEAKLHAESLKAVQPHERAGDGERWVISGHASLSGNGAPPVAHAKLIHELRLQPVPCHDVDDWKLGPLRKLNGVQLRHSVSLVCASLRRPHALILMGVPRRGWKLLSRRYRRNLAGLVSELRGYGVVPWLVVPYDRPRWRLPWDMFAVSAVVVFTMPHDVDPVAYGVKLRQRAMKAGIPLERIGLCVPSSVLPGWQDHHEFARQTGIGKIITDPR